tara:strand:- start:1673 stop:2524 length:852 start_codon:yes stop_codon:yes gene_type:complete
MDFIESANKTANNILDTYVYGNPVISSVLSLFLVLYAGLAAPKLPKKIAKLFGNEIFRITILVCIAYMASKDASMSIISAVALVISLQTLSYHEANEVVATTIADEAAKVQIEDPEEYVFDEQEEIPAVFEPQPEPTTEEPTTEEPTQEPSVLDSEPEFVFPAESTEAPVTESPIEDEVEVQESTEEVSEETAQEPAPSAELPQGDDTRDHVHAGYLQMSENVEDNSEKIQDNTNRIDQLEKLIKKQVQPSAPVQVSAEAEAQAAPAPVYNVSPFGGDSYAEF